MSDHSKKWRFSSRVVRELAACTSVLIAALSLAAPAHADALTPGTYQLVATETTKCLTSGTQVQGPDSIAIMLRPCDRSGNNGHQLWITKVDRQSRGFYFQNQATGRCLTLESQATLSGRTVYEPGLAVIEEDCIAGPAWYQLWSEDNLNGHRALVSHRDRFCVSFGADARYRDCAAVGVAEAKWYGFSLREPGKTSTHGASGSVAKGPIRSVSAPRVLEAHADTVEFVAFSPDGTRVLSGGLDDQVLIWDPKSLAITARLTGHERSEVIDGVLSGAWSPDGKQVVTGGSDATMRIWDARTGTQQRVLDGHRFNEKTRRSAGVRAVIWAPNGQSIVSMGTNENMAAILWNAQSLSPIETPADFNSQNRGVFSASLSPDQSRLAVGSRDGVLRIWDIASRRIVHEWRPPNLSSFQKIMGSVDWSPDGTKIVTTSWDGGLRIWDVRTGQMIRRLDLDQLTEAKWSPDGAYILTDGHGNIIEAATGRIVHKVERNNTSLYTVDWSPDGRTIVAGATRKKVLVWQLDR
ncbi:MAG: RICIN domain-containing protein [Pseudomonadota bacterium]